MTRFPSAVTFRVARRPSPELTAPLMNLSEFMSLFDDCLAIRGDHCADGPINQPTALFSSVQKTAACFSHQRRLILMLPTAPTLMALGFLHTRRIKIKFHGLLFFIREYKHTH